MYEYLTGEEMLPSNQKHNNRTKLNLLILLWEKAFQKQIKTIKDQGKKQFEALKDLKPKDQTKAVDTKSANKSNQSIAANIFNDLIKKRKGIMNEFYESVDKNKLYFECVGLNN